RAGRSRTCSPPVAQQSACRVQGPPAICRATDCSPRRCSAGSQGSTPRSSEIGWPRGAALAISCATEDPMSRSAQARKPQQNDIADRVAALDWTRIGGELDAHGCATTGALLSPDECAALSSRYDEDGLYRSRVIMARHGFGRGEYKYFAYPLTDIVASMRAALYPPLAEVANRWNGQLGLDQRFAADHAAHLKRCHAAGQAKPTPLLLQYGPGDYNCLHQDVSGELLFPLQVALLLSRPGEDFSGGEFVLTEQRPRMQSRAEVVPLTQGEGVIFPVHHRPVQGTRSVYRVTMRHGVSRLRSGQRHTLGIIFHDAK